MDGERKQLDQRDYVLECVCDEPNNKVVRFVRPTKLTLEHFQFIWEKLSQFDVLFNDWTRGDFKAFVDRFIQKTEDGTYICPSLMWDVDDVGLFVLSNVRPAISAEAHFTFWDRRFSGREDLCRAMLQYVFDRYKFKRIEVRIPIYARPALAAVERIGFIHEGRLRDSVLYKDNWHDVNLYSMLPKDMEDTPRHNTSVFKRKTVCQGCGKKYKTMKGVGV